MLNYNDKSRFPCHPTTPIQDRIRNNSFIDVDGCWIWTQHRVSNGYGRIRLGPKNLMAHRVAFEAFKHQIIPAGYVVDHTCHNPDTCLDSATCKHRGCVNPDHMALVTVAENNSPKRRRAPLHIGTPVPQIGDGLLAAAFIEESLANRDTYAQNTINYATKMRFLHLCAEVDRLRISLTGKAL